jgi:hypothetical protein
MEDFTTRQITKLRSVWAWCEGQKPARGNLRVSAISDTEIRLGTGPLQGPGQFWGWHSKEDVTPDLSDEATADGLLRTCRRAWGDADAFVMRSLSGKWKVYIRSGTEEFVFEGATEQQALLTAIFASPEKA